MFVFSVLSALFCKVGCASSACPHNRFWTTSHLTCALIFWLTHIISFAHALFDWLIVLLGPFSISSLDTFCIGLICPSYSSFPLNCRHTLSSYLSWVSTSKCDNASIIKTGLWQRGRELQTQNKDYFGRGVEEKHGVWFARTESVEGNVSGQLA